MKIKWEKLLSVTACLNRTMDRTSMPIAHYPSSAALRCRLYRGQLACPKVRKVMSERRHVVSGKNKGRKEGNKDKGPLTDEQQEKCSFIRSHCCDMRNSTAIQIIRILAITVLTR